MNEIEYNLFSLESMKCPTSLSVFEGATKYLVKCFRNVIASDPEFRLLT